MSSSSIRTLAFVALSALVLTSSCGTFLSMEPYAPAGKSLSFDD